MLLRDLNRPRLHVLWGSNLIHNSVLQRLGARPFVRLEQHLPRNLRAQLQPRQRANALEMQSQVHRGHAEKPALGVHDAIVTAQGKRTGTAERVARDERDRRERVVQQGRQEREEAVGVGEGVAFALVEVEPCAPEFGVGAFDDHAAGLVGADAVLDMAEGGYQGLSEGGRDAVFGRLLHRDDVDGGVRRGDGEVLEGWLRRHGEGVEGWYEAVRYSCLSTSYFLVTLWSDNNKGTSQLGLAEMRFLGSI